MKQKPKTKRARAERVPYQLTPYQAVGIRITLPGHKEPVTITDPIVVRLTAAEAAELNARVLTDANGPDGRLPDGAELLVQRVDTRHAEYVAAIDSPGARQVYDVQLQKDHRTSGAVIPVPHEHRVVQLTGHATIRVHMRPAQLAALKAQWGWAVEITPLRKPAPKRPSGAKPPPPDVPPATAGEATA